MTKQEAIAALGSGASLAQVLGVTRQAIHQRTAALDDAEALLVTATVLRRLIAIAGVLEAAVAAPAPEQRREQR